MVRSGDPDSGLAEQTAVSLQASVLCGDEMGSGVEHLEGAWPAANSR